MPPRQSNESLPNPAEQDGRRHGAGQHDRDVYRHEADVHDALADVQDNTADFVRQEVSQPEGSESVTVQILHCDTPFFSLVIHSDAAKKKEKTRLYAEKLSESLITYIYVLFQIIELMKHCESNKPML